MMGNELTLPKPSPMDIILKGLRPTIDDGYEQKKIKEWKEDQDGERKGFDTN